MASVRVREVAGPEQGRALGDALFGRTVRVRERTHPLGNVITGAHSHGSVRHTHDRLPSAHLHCPSCGSDTRLCLENPHHEPGAIPARESDTGPAGFGKRVGDLLFQDTGPSKMSCRDLLALEQVERAARAKQPARQATATDRRLADAWARACGGNRP